MSYEIKGIIVKIYDKQVITDKFEKKEFVIKTEEDYPQEIKFELKQKAISLLDEYEVGDDVVLNFNIKGKERNGSYWNNLDVWRVRKIKDEPIADQNKKKGKKKSKESFEEPVFENPTKDSDMPF
jgi:single-strand DNA-binding protein